MTAARVRVLAASVGVVAVGAATATGLRLVGTRPSVALACGGLVAAGVLGLLLASSASTPAQFKAELGTGLLVGVVVAAAAAWLQQELQSSIQQSASEQSFRLTLTLQRDLEGIDATHRRLDHLYLRRRDFRFAHFDGTWLRHADLTGDPLGHAVLLGAHLEGAILTASRLGAANFTGAHMREASLQHAKGQDVQVPGADMHGIFAQHCRLPFLFAGRTSATDARTVLSGGHFDYARLPDAQLDNVMLQGAELRRARLDRADLSSADIRNSDLDHASLRDAILGHADLRGIRNVRTADLSGARYDRATRWPTGFDPVAAGARLAR